MSVEELPAFLSLLAHFDGSVEDIQKMEKFSVNRADDNFWEVYDWFQERFSRDNPETAGLFDLNRYYYEAR